MSESQSIKCVKRFVVDIVEAFGLVFWEHLNAQDMTQLLEKNATRGFKVCLTPLIECIPDYPASWHGQLRSHRKHSTIILEAMADEETWIWHFLCPVLVITTMFFTFTYVFEAS
jgi:hypothetical protein